MKLPSLYKKSGKKIQEWTIGTNENVIVTCWGQIEGKKQDSKEYINEGKNLGKKNETSPKEQAQSEAESRWQKKKDKGYVESLERANLGETDNAGGISVMLAHKFSDHGDKIVFPAYVQPKFDGHRCIAVLKDGACTLWSRGRKPITSVPHINRAIEKQYKNDVILDGELYNHMYREHFEELTHIIKQTKPTENHEIMLYQVYDVAGPGGFSVRRKLIVEKGPLCAVPTIKVDDLEEIMQWFETWRKDGYEGAIVRSYDAPYEYKRSYHLQKIKEFQDDEFRIVAIVDGRGKMEGKAVFSCVTKDGGVFEVKMKGSLERLKDIFNNAEQYIGKSLTVRYQGFTKKNNLPRCPVGVRIYDGL